MYKIFELKNRSLHTLPREFTFSGKSAALGLLPILVLFFCSCRKEAGLNLDPSIRLGFSTDTVIFDTVFTSVGSTTKQFKVYNPTRDRINISKIFLAGGEQSQFRINVDGVPGNALNVEIMPRDSLFIFVEVTVNPLNANAPLIVTDSILFEINGKMQDIDLVAWGQDAHYILADRSIRGFPPFKIVAGENQVVTWTNDKPWVVYGYAVVDSAGTLNIEAGTRVHFHRNGGLWVYRYGKLNVNGVREQPVTFQGDRLDYAYRYVPGQWDRIWINEGATSTIRYAEIRNGFIGIQAETIIGRDAGDQSGLIIHDTKIENMAAYGLYAIYYNIRAHNLLSANCKEHTLAITLGGSYSFRHCTFANYWTNPIRQGPSVVINNANSVQAIPLDSCHFYNSIIYGNYDGELALDENTSQPFNYRFENCLLKIGTGINTADGNRFVNLVSNPALINGSEDPVFEDPSNDKYKLREGSAAADIGSPGLLPIVPYDIEGTPRQFPPDAGCYEQL